MSEATWRQATEEDLDTVVSIQERVHTLEPESRAVFAAKLQAFPRGCRVLGGPEGLVGYGIFHPWRLNHAPCLHALPFVMPDPADCLFVHDVALLPAARGRNAARALVGTVAQTATDLGIRHGALVSVYGTVPFWERLGFVPSPLPFDAVKQAQYGETARYMVTAFGP